MKFTRGGEPTGGTKDGSGGLTKGRMPKQVRSKPVEFSRIRTPDTKGSLRNPKSIMSQGR